MKKHLATLKTAMAALAVLAAPTMASCNPTNTQETAPAAQQARAESAAPAAATAAAPQPGQQAKRDDASFARLLDPSQLNAKAPDQFKVRIHTTRGDMTLEVDRSMAPLGADRFYNLVTNGFFNDIALFRMVRGFVVQFGIHGAPIVSGQWRDANINDDPVLGTNTRGTLSFATSGPNSRTTQMFINLNDNIRLDAMGFAPIGRITEGIEVLDQLNFEYAERPSQPRIQKEGNAYLKANFPNLDYITSMEVI